MLDLKIHMCDVCGYSKDRAGLCPYCQTPLSIYTKEEQKEYQVDMEEAMRVMSDLKWYI